METQISTSPRGKFPANESAWLKETEQRTPGKQQLWLASGLQVQQPWLASDLQVQQLWLALDLQVQQPWLASQVQQLWPSTGNCDR